MKIIEHRAQQRGQANYGWLHANYSFSFANYYDANRMNFGALRVLNDDVVQGGQGFGRHPHDNMEIITIPLYGSLKHQDSMSENWIPIETNDVQVMSAGKGILHSERNNSPSESINLFQIWILPDEQNVKPSYSQMTFDPIQRKNQLQTLVTSYVDQDINSLKIHQDVIISRIDLSKNEMYKYRIKSSEHGVYTLLVNGKTKISDTVLQKRDALGIYDTDTFTIEAKEDSELLFIEVPMMF